MCKIGIYISNNEKINEFYFFIKKYFCVLRFQVAPFGKIRRDVLSAEVYTDQ